MMRIASMTVLLALAACSRDRAPAARHLPPDEAAAVLIDRNWLDLWPTSETERLHVYRFTPSMGGGVFQDRTLFEGHFELFTYQIEGEHLTIQWPHSKTQDRMVFRVDRVRGPAPFDLKLELSSPSHGPRTYYGRSKETAADAARWDLPPH